MFECQEEGAMPLVAVQSGRPVGAVAAEVDEKCPSWSAMTVEMPPKPVAVARRSHWQWLEGAKHRR